MDKGSDFDHTQTQHKPKLKPYTNPMSRRSGQSVWLQNPRSSHSACWVLLLFFLTSTIQEAKKISACINTVFEYMYSCCCSDAKSCPTWQLQGLPHARLLLTCVSVLKITEVLAAKKTCRKSRNESKLEDFRTGIRKDTKDHSMAFYEEHQLLKLLMSFTAFPERNVTSFFSIESQVSTTELETYL